jgi:hypothetical protein
MRCREIHELIGLERGRRVLHGTPEVSAAIFDGGQLAYTPAPAAAAAAGPKVTQNLLDHLGILGAGNDPRLSAAVIAPLDVDREHPLQALRPAHRRRPQGSPEPLRVAATLQWIIRNSRPPPDWELEIRTPHADRGRAEGKAVHGGSLTRLPPPVYTIDKHEEPSPTRGTLPKGASGPAGRMIAVSTNESVWPRQPVLRPGKSAPTVKPLRFGGGVAKSTGHCSYDP